MNGHSNSASGPWVSSSEGPREAASPVSYMGHKLHHQHYGKPHMGSNGGIVPAAQEDHDEHTIVAQAGAALSYGFSSLAIMFVNKIVLSVWNFPSFNFLAACQFCSTALILFTLNKAGKVNITPLSREVLRAIAPLALVSLMNVLMGLGGTKRLNLPMFTVLRRFTILLTMILETHYGLIRPTKGVKVSVFMMIFGALVAAASDLAFDLEGYIMIFLNDIFTSLTGVVMKKTLVSKKINNMGVLFHNSWIGALIMLGVLSISPLEMQRVQEFKAWNSPVFVSSFITASVMGSVLNYATFLCTALNSALTTTVVGCLKNVLTTYLGMLLLPDYVFSWSNFLGLNISIGGSLLYSYYEFNAKMIQRERQSAQRVRQSLQKVSEDAQDTELLLRSQSKRSNGDWSDTESPRVAQQRIG